MPWIFKIRNNKTKEIKEKVTIGYLSYDDATKELYRLYPDYTSVSAYYEKPTKEAEIRFRTFKIGGVKQ